MRSTKIRANLLMFLAAAIWGLAFVAQRVGAQYLGSFSFNGIRFALGSLSLLPILLYSDQKSTDSTETSQKFIAALPGGILAGVILFTASSLQQIGLIDTSAGKAAFITGLYLVFVPILGIFLKQRTYLNTWLGVILATIGLYFLSVTEHLSIVTADLLELAGAFFWSLHILVIDHFSKKVATLHLCVTQFSICSLLSIGVALFFETTTISGIQQALIPILYGGVFSVGVAYTLQVIGQRHAKPAHAAIILSLEAVFASLGGLIILNENLGVRGYLGCALMLSGMLLSQLPQISNTQVAKSESTKTN